MMPGESLHFPLPFLDHLLAHNGIPERTKNLVRHFLYIPVGCDRIKVLLKNYKLSDDLAFRFGNKGWASYPLDAQTYAQWIHAHHGDGNTINLFMDYETFGEHQWEDTGIFNFMRALPQMQQRRAAAR